MVCDTLANKQAIDSVPGHAINALRVSVLRCDR